MVIREGIRNFRLVYPIVQKILNFENFLDSFIKYKLKNGIAKATLATLLMPFLMVMFN